MILTLMMMRRRSSRTQIWVQKLMISHKIHHHLTFLGANWPRPLLAFPLGPKCCLAKWRVFLEKVAHQWDVNCDIYLNIIGSNLSRARWDSTSHLSQDIWNPRFADWWKKRDEFAKVVAQKRIKLKQDPVSTMQKTGWTNYSPFLVWLDVEKGFHLGCDH